MDDNAKNTSSYQLDQEILDARGINMTVEEVAGLSTCKYSERVQSLNLSDEDLAFLKGLRRRIKNRLASQNSRRRSVEHLRRLARELRVVRACRDDALTERKALVTQRDTVRDHCIRLRRYIVQILQDRSDLTEIPSIDVEKILLKSQKQKSKIITVAETKMPMLPECFDKTALSDNSNTSYDISEESFSNSEKTFTNSENKFSKSEKMFANSEKMFANSEIFFANSENKFANSENKFANTENKFANTENKFKYSEKFTDSEKIFANSEKLTNDEKNNIFECRIDKLVQQSVNHIFKSDEKKKVFAKTVFISNDKYSSVKSMVLKSDLIESDNGVLNLSLKEGRRKSHGRKQLAPRRIAYVYTDGNDGVLDLKIKKESQ